MEVVPRIQEHSAVGLIHFAVAFAETDLAPAHPLREGDWSNLRDEIRAYLNMPIINEAGGFGAALKKGKAELMAYTPKEYEALKEETRSLLVPVADADEMLRGGKGRSSCLSFPTIEWQVLAQPRGGPAILLARGSVRDLFLQRLIFLLSRHGLENIRRCADPTCRRLFWRGRRDQVHHSRACQNRMNMRSWLSRKKKGTKSRKSGRTRTGGASAERRTR